MRHEVLMEMSKAELDEYASVIGVDVSGKKTVAQKAAAIEDRRCRVAEIDVLGMTVSVPVKRMRDKRVSDLVSKHRLSDADASELMSLILGEKQVEALTERATDEDGTVDVDAIGLAIARILGSDDLKNY